MCPNSSYRRTWWGLPRTEIRRRWYGTIYGRQKKAGGTHRVVFESNKTITTVQTHTDDRCDV